jgi:hypothetical protein
VDFIAPGGSYGASHPKVRPAQRVEIDLPAGVVDWEFEAATLLSLAEVREVATEITITVPLEIDGIYPTGLLDDEEATR